MRKRLLSRYFNVVGSMEKTILVTVPCSCMIQMQMKFLLKIYILVYKTGVKGVSSKGAIVSSYNKQLY